MKFVRRFFGLIFLGVFFVALFIGCEYYGRSARNFYMDTPGQTATGSIDFARTSVDRLVEYYVNNEIERDIVITATGDQKFYEWQLERAYDQKTKTFDFSKSYKYISKYFDNSHYVIGDIETTLAGSGKGADSVIFGYLADKDNNLFNTPEILADNLSEAGFDMITTANEHALDSGVEGLKSTIKNLEKSGLEVIGTRTSSATDNYTIKTVSGLKVGFMGYTVWLNNLDESFYGDGYYGGDAYYDGGYYDEAYYDQLYYGDDEYYQEVYGTEEETETEAETEETEDVDREDTTADLVNYLYEYDEEKIQAMCDQVRELKSQTEAVIIMLHFGNQFTSAPDEYANDICQKLVDAGADVIFGTHTHVPGTVKVVKAKNPDGTERNALVVYSMGNFLTSQQYVDESYQYRDMGYIMSVIFKKGKNGVRIGGLNMVPVYSNWTDDNIATIPILEAHDDPDAFGDIFDDTGKSRIKDGAENIFPQIVGNCGYPYVYDEYSYKISIEN